MKKKKIIKTSAIIIILLFIVISTDSIIRANILEKQFYKKQIKNTYYEYNYDDHPEYYNITIWNFKGFICTKEIKKVSFDIAMSIKKDYEEIDQNIKNPGEIIIQKREVLKRYNIFEGDLIRFYNKTNNNYKNYDIFNYKSDVNRKTFLGLISGYFHGPIRGINIGFFLINPLFNREVYLGFYHEANGYGPCSILCGDLLNYTLVITEKPSDRVYLWFSFGFGTLTYLPFLINGNNFDYYDFTFFVISGGVDIHEF